MAEGSQLQQFSKRFCWHWKIWLVAGCLLTGSFYFSWSNETQQAWRYRCEARLNTGSWSKDQLIECQPETMYIATCGPELGHHWHWRYTSTQCGYHRLNQDSLRSLLADKWVVFAGDSITRNLYAALLRQVADPSANQTIQKAHSNFEHVLPNNIKASFFWAPYTENMTSVLSEWHTQPNTLVISLGLWHMLHIHNTSGFRQGLQTLTKPLMQLVNNGDNRSQAPMMHVVSITEIAQEKLKAEDKKQNMTRKDVKLYNEALSESALLQPRGSAYTIDLHAITKGCGPECTEDGVHFNNATYDAALQIWANSLLLEERV